MNVLPSMSSMRAPAARRMNSGVAPTDLNARTGLSTPPGRIACARANRRAERADFMSPDRDGRQIADGGGEKPDFVLVARSVACGGERARRAVEIAVQEKRRRDASRGAIRGGVALEGALEQRPRQRGVVGHEGDVAGTLEVFR